MKIFKKRSVIIQHVHMESHKKVYWLRTAFFTISHKVEHDLGIRVVETPVQ